MLKQKLHEILTKHMQRVERNYHNLNEEKEKLTQRLQEIEKERANFIEKQSRADGYPVNSDYCPVCFVDKGLSAHVKPIASDNELDKFKCRHCGYTFEVES